MKKTKIICTIGPAVDEPAVLEKLMLAGMDVARINFSHGNYQDQAPRIETVKQVREKVGKPVALMLDTKGPEIRIGKFQDGGIELKEGDIFTLVTDEILGDKEKVSITYKNLCNEVNVGTMILINDGLIKVEVVEIQGTDIKCKVIDGGPLTNTKSINIPGMYINLPSPTEKDIEDIKFGITVGFDYIAASFVRTPQDVLNIRKILEENNGAHIKIISKIENRQGIDNFDEILEVSDGIMVARGDLGVEIPMEEVPIRQKEFISKCNKAGKPVIIATQMLESMIHSPRPTRAEVSDVANAVYDMTSCIMLSGESAMGEYPVECVKTMVRICEAIEGSLKYWKRFKNKQRDCGNVDYEYNLNYSTCSTAMDLCAKAIFAYTDTGRTAKMLAGFMPQCPIYVITANKEVCKQLSMIWNANAILVDAKESIDDMIDEGVRIAKEKKYIESGDIVVIAGGASILAGHKHAKLNRTIGGVLKV
ncbi:MAG: pyruvate kinase [Clostridia bacterium]|nr:pyruvate kinase [Clostridia bacterium]MCI9413086.1 pyruvate kinase [Clostridia bacterium]